MDGFAGSFEHRGEVMLLSRGIHIKFNPSVMSFLDINSALEQISHYRQNALPKMAQTIVEFDRLTAAGEATIQQIEAGAAKRPALQILAD